MNLKRIKSQEFVIEKNQKTYGIEWQNIKNQTDLLEISYRRFIAY